VEVRVVCADITKFEADAIIVNLFEGVARPGGATGAVDGELGGAISQLIEAGEIRGKLGEVTIIHSLGRLPAARVAVAGLGKQEQFDQDKIRVAMAEACRALRRLKARHLASIVHGAGAGGLEPATCVQALVEGSILGLYRFAKHGAKEHDEAEVEVLTVVTRDEAQVPPLQQGAFRGKVLAEATNLARDLINQPANYMTPTHLAQVAQRLAEQHGLECQVLEREQMEGLGMGGLLGVAQGSRQPPKLIVLRYRGNPSSSEDLGLVGKGITFDSGGISIKPSERMAEMKADMSGGAAVIAALGALAQLKPRLNITALVPAAENLPGGSALKPGDVVTAMNGKTIEIVTTDAEGRLILCDALSYAKKLGLSPIIDLATLTGAIHVALGDLYSGLFSNDPGLRDKLLQAGEREGERHWPMPLPQEYKEQLKSEVADIKNVGNRWGGAIIGALFLAEFVGDTPWAHLDIGGTAYMEKEHNYLVKGATGVGVRTLIDLALALAEERS